MGFFLIQRIPSDCLLVYFCCARLLRYALFRKSQLRFNSRLTTDLSLLIASEISFCLYPFLCMHAIVYLCAKVRCAIIELFGRGEIYPKDSFPKGMPLAWKTHYTIQKDYTIQKEGGKHFPLSSEKMC